MSIIRTKEMSFDSIFSSLLLFLFYLILFLQISFSNLEDNKNLRIPKEKSNQMMNLLTG